MASGQRVGVIDLRTSDSPTHREMPDAKSDLPFVTDTYNSGGESRSLQNTYAEDTQHDC